jgi:methionyl-tRNA synthetase
MASLLHYARSGAAIDFDAYWGPDSDVELYHFLGKDIVYFHALFWPAVLSGSGYRTPTGIYAHGFLTVDGQKMSKRRGTFITAETYLQHLAPDYLRYYYAAKLGPTVDDIDLNLDDFVARVNSDLVGKLVNIASRCAGFVHRCGDGRMADALAAPELFAEFAGACATVAAHYERREYSKAMRKIMALADQANQYIDEHKPWAMAKSPGQETQIVAVCSQGLNMFRVLVGMLKPVLPQLAERAEAFLAIQPLTWAELATPLTAHTIERFKPLLQRIDPKAVARMVSDSKSVATAPAAAPTEALEGEIDIDAFARVDLRVARVLAAERVEGADKLLRLTVDLGHEQREILAGIRSAYEPEQLVDRLVVVVANLKPRKMRFGISQGMVLAAGPGGKDIFLLSPDADATPGMRVR